MKPNLHYLKVWDCLTYAKIPNIKIFKLGPKTYNNETIIGYCKYNKTYRFLNLDNNEIIESKYT